MEISTKIQNIKPSPTIAMNSKAKELKAQGKDIISLSAGEPDFNTFDNICEAAITAIKQEKTKYTAVDGTVELKDAIISKFKRDSNIKFGRENITVGSGGKQVIYNALVASINPGDEVIGMELAEETKSLLTVTEHGYGKRSPIVDYRLISRGGKGVRNIKTSSRNGKVVSIKTVSDEDEIIAISENGIVIRMQAKDISIIGRNTQGVRVMRLREGDKVTTVAKIVTNSVEEDESDN